MFGWEFPPFFAGGVGMVCYELTKQLVDQGVDVDYVMPYFPEGNEPNFLNIVDVSKKVTEKELEEQTKSGSFTITKVRSILAAYQTQEEYEKTIKEISFQQPKGLPPTKKSGDSTKELYGENLLDEIHLFTKRVAILAEKGYFDKFDIIHAHDWTTVPAAAAVKRITGKPLVVHVHITDVNKNSGAGANPEIYAMEREGFFAADKIASVSQYIKGTLMDEYGVPGEKIEVVHNGGITMEEPGLHDGTKFKEGNKLISYMGRVTGMKGPTNFVEMAPKILEHCPKTKFLLAGTGDQLQACIDKTKELGIHDKFYFHGFYSKKEAEFFYDISDVFLMPSLMEPFGVVPLEAMSKKTPTVVSKQSGVSEAISHCFKADSWDINKMASQVVTLLKYPQLHATMSQNGYDEAQALTWEKPANECMELYNNLLR